MRKSKNKKYKLDFSLDLNTANESKVSYTVDKTKSPYDKFNFEIEKKNFCNKVNEAQQERLINLEKQENQKHSNMPFKKQNSSLMKTSIDSLKEVKTYDFPISKDRTFTKKKLGKTFSLDIDTEAINELYLYGGDKHQSNQTSENKEINFEQKIKLLAQHCVDFIEKADESQNCCFFHSDMLFREKDCSLSEMNESLSKYRIDKNNEKMNIDYRESNNRSINNNENNNNSNTKQIELNKYCDDDLNKHKLDVTENEVDLEENGFSSSFSIKKFNLETTKFTQGKSKYNSFSAKAPLPTSKNKDSKSFSFGKKLELETSDIKDSESKYGIENFNLNINEKNDSRTSALDLELTCISENTSKLLTLPKDKKSFLRSKKPMNRI